MLKKLRDNPLPASLVVLVLYAGWFILPAFIVKNDPEQHGISGIDGAISQWPNEAIIAISLIIIVTLLGWWQKIGFQRVHQGGIKYLLPPVLLALTVLVASDQVSYNTSWFLGFAGPAQLASMILVILGIGFTEETMFRGILFHGLETRFTPFITVLISAGIFGVFHYVNLFMGAPFYDTSYQVIHAAAAGFMYATLRLRIGAIWPVMLFHGLWDFCLFDIETLHHTTSDVAVTSSFSLLKAGLIIFPAVTYGAFVYWRWSVRRDSTEQNKRLQLKENRQPSLS